MAVETTPAACRSELLEVLERMRPGEKATLVDEAGLPLATIVSPDPEPGQPMSLEEWEAEWDALVDEVSKAWKSEKSAVELVSEMRR